PMDTLVHALLSIKTLPAEQKRAWQTLFNHYVFEQEPNALSHIPDEVLGVLGDIDDATAKQLWAMLRRKLEK
ncbi:MAG: cupin-like domain-containing protein, partial [Cellvibrionales bacterium]|nr:cupin-like domain-containing protein [Cellvibrionales bacterium]